jgi:hypothetical protein
MLHARAPPHRKRDRGHDRYQEHHGRKLEGIGVLRIENTPELLGVAVRGGQRSSATGDINAKTARRNYSDDLDYYDNSGAPQS